MTPSIWSLFKWSSQSISHPDVLSRCDNWCVVVTHSSSIAVSLFLNPRYSSTLCSTNSRLQIHRHRILGPLCFLDWNCALLWVGAEKHAFASRSCFDPTESQLRMSLSRADRWLRAMTSRLGTILWQPRRSISSFTGLGQSTVSCITTCTKLWMLEAASAELLKSALWTASVLPSVSTER